MNRLLRVIGRAAFWLGWPLLWLMLRHSERTRVLVQAEGKVLLVKNFLSDGGWGLPGGGLHTDEPKNAGAAREVHEETGLRLDSQQMTLLATELCRVRGLSFEVHYFVADVPAPMPLRRQKWEVAAARWVSRNELGNLPLRPDVRRALELLDKRLG